MKEWECFVRRNANQKKWTWDRKIVAWLSELLPFDLGYSLGNGIFVFLERINFVQFRCFVELKFGEFVEKLFFRPEEVFEDRNLSRRQKKIVFMFWLWTRTHWSSAELQIARVRGDAAGLGCRTVFWVSRVTMNAN